jgi:hypothetical protein
MRRFVCLGVLALGLLAQGDVGGGPVVPRYKGAPEKCWEGRRVEANSSRYLQDRFSGGERASVILIGDHDPVMDLALYVYDADGNCVARDDDGGDTCAVEWYPPQTARYSIEVRNRGRLYNATRLSIR